MILYGALYNCLCGAVHFLVIVKKYNGLNHAESRLSYYLLYLIVWTMALATFGAPLDRLWQNA